MSSTLWYALGYSNIYNLNEVVTNNCPGSDCIRGFFNINCEELSNSAKGYYNWTTVYRGSNDFHTSIDSSPLPSEWPLDSNHGVLEGFSSCFEAKEHFYSKFTENLEAVSKQFRESTLYSLHYRILKLVSVDMTSAQVGLSLLAVVLTTWGIWKRCHKKRY